LPDSLENKKAVEEEEVEEAVEAEVVEADVEGVAEEEEAVEDLAAAEEEEVVEELAVVAAVEAVVVGEEGDFEEMVVRIMTKVDSCDPAENVVREQTREHVMKYGTQV